MTYDVVANRMTDALDHITLGKEVTQEEAIDLWRDIMQNIADETDNDLISAMTLLVGAYAHLLPQDMLDEFEGMVVFHAL
jgi:hypothetical protein